MTYLYIPTETTLQVIGINGLNTGTTLLVTTEAAERYSIGEAMLELTAVSGFTTAATISIGTNSTSYNNLAAAQSTTISTLVRKGVTLVTPIPSVAPGTAIYVNVTIGAVATTYTFNIFLLGFYY